MLSISKQFVAFLFLLFFIIELYAEDDKTLETVESSARAWLNLPDNGKYAESWKNASTLFQAKQSESDWGKNMKAIRSPLGTMKSRHIATAHIATSLPGMPDGEYVIVQFYTSFEHQTLALETVTTVKEKDDTWRVSEYLIE